MTLVPKTLARYGLAALLLAAAPAAFSLPALAQMSSQEATMATTAIISAGQRAAAVARIDHVPSVGAVRLKRQIMRLNEEDDGADFTNFASEASRHQAGIARLRAALARNPATAEALARHHIDIGDVVGVMVSSNGSLRLYLL